jgi:SAM-dependent methyltransferase
MPEAARAPAGLAPQVRERLRCPGCRGHLAASGAGLACEACGTKYEPAASGAHDLRLRAERSCALELRLGAPAPDAGAFALAPLAPDPEPQVDFAGLALPRHLGAALRSWFPRARAPDALALDLGCGSASSRASCERAGFTWVGLDLRSPHAPLLGDAHALPFADESFGLVLSLATLEHLRHPPVALREVHRVLVRGGAFLGSVAFLEPYHGESYYHPSHLGTLDALRGAGLRVAQLAPSEGWDVLRAQAKLLFPGLPRPAAVALVNAVRRLDSAWCRMARALGRVDDAQLRRYRRATAGSFAFVAYRD